MRQMSARRAEAVKAYLVQSGRIDANKISAIGKGKSAPVTRPGDCQAITALHHQDEIDDQQQVRNLLTNHTRFTGGDTYGDGSGQPPLLLGVR